MRLTLKHMSYTVTQNGSSASSKHVRSKGAMFLSTLIFGLCGKMSARNPFNCPFTSYTKRTVHQNWTRWYLHVSTRIRKGQGLNRWFGYCVSCLRTWIEPPKQRNTQVRWQAAVGTNVQRITNGKQDPLHPPTPPTPPEAGKATAPVTADPRLFVSVRACICMLLFDCACMPRWRRGMLL